MGLAPIFCLRRSLMELSKESLQPVLAGLGYELVELEKARNGLVRIFLDHPNGIKVEDCVRVSNHLTRLFAVEGIGYDRLEVSSPGLDRPVRTLEEFSRFKGQLAKVKLVGLVDGRKRFTGRIAAVAPDGSIDFSDVQDAPGGTGIRVTLDQIDKARLEPEL
jgi:ribosome maturation factor RimP